MKQDKRNMLKKKVQGTVVESNPKGPCGLTTCQIERVAPAHTPYGEMEQGHCKTCDKIVNLTNSIA